MNYYIFSIFIIIVISVNTLLFVSGNFFCVELLRMYTAECKCAKGHFTQVNIVLTF